MFGVHHLEEERRPPIGLRTIPVLCSRLSSMIGEELVEMAADHVEADLCWAINLFGLHEVAVISVSGVLASVGNRQHPLLPQHYSLRAGKLDWKAPQGSLMDHL